MYDSTTTIANYIDGFGQWITEYCLRGWQPYYINFTFDLLVGNQSAIMHSMKTGIHTGFYSRFCTEFTSNPRSRNQQGKLPKLILAPDYPCFKSKTTSAAAFKANDGGLHFNGFLLIPPISRFRECPIEHIAANRSHYFSHGIRNIHLTEVYDVVGAVDYSCKTIKRRMASLDDIFILPFSVSELPDKKSKRISASKVLEKSQSDQQWLEANYVLKSKI